MEIDPLHISGSSILPLPPLNGDNSVVPVKPARDFSFELAEKTQKKEQVDFFPSQKPEGPFSYNEENDELMQVCKELEGFLISMLLRSMGKSFSDSGVFGSSYESSVYKDMFFTELADSVGKDGPGLGIAQTLYDDIIMKIESGAPGIDVTG